MPSSTTWPPTPSPTSDRLTVGGQFEHLWAGWRASYIESVTGGEPRPEPPGEGSLFERLLRLPDDEAFVVYRGTRCSALLNAYPYTNGHLLVLPNRAVEELSELDADEMTELWSVVRDGVAALRAAYGCDGVNVGMNLGAAAGRRCARASACPCVAALARRHQLHDHRRHHPRAPRTARRQLAEAPHRLAHHPRPNGAPGQMVSLRQSATSGQERAHRLTSAVPNDSREHNVRPSGTTADPVSTNFGFSSRKPLTTHTRSIDARARRAIARDRWRLRRRDRRPCDEARPTTSRCRARRSGYPAEDR